VAARVGGHVNVKIAKGVVAIETGPNELHIGSSVGDANLSAVFHPKYISTSRYVNWR
jgi:hypothetical protein